MANGWAGLMEGRCRNKRILISSDSSSKFAASDSLIPGAPYEESGRKAPGHRAAWFEDQISRALSILAVPESP